MFLKLDIFKNFIVITAIILTSLFLDIKDSIAESVSIKGAMKIHRMGGYIIAINYQTYDKWTDNLLFKVYCKFDEEEFTFVSSALHNIEHGWHKTEISISDVIKKRYGSLRNYKIELYKAGILVDTRESY